MKFLILLIILMFTSCSGQNHDLHDDQDLHDSDNVTDIDSLDAANDEKADVDTSDTAITDTDISDDEFIDDCDPRLIDAPFPYYDKDGNITFCRPCCDTPTEKDPQCASNLWKEINLMKMVRLFILMGLLNLKVNGSYIRREAQHL